MVLFNYLVFDLLDNVISPYVQDLIMTSFYNKKDYWLSRPGFKGHRMIHHYCKAKDVYLTQKGDENPCVWYFGGKSCNYLQIPINSI